MNIVEAEKIVHEFGAAVENSAKLAGGAAPLSMLPCPEDRIKLAIKTCMTGLIRTHKYSAENGDVFKTGYMMLAKFIPDDQAKTVTDVYSALETKIQIQDEGRRAWEMVQIGAGADFAKSVEILKGITKRTSELKKEIEMFELEQLCECPKVGTKLVLFMDHDRKGRWANIRMDNGDPC